MIPSLCKINAGERLARTTIQQFLKTHHGPGIPRETRDEVLLPFLEGTGLGLAIVKEIVEVDQGN
ncbi:MAG: ATP-binding protein [Syntrophobacteraceae bacterium]